LPAILADASNGMTIRSIASTLRFTGVICDLMRMIRDSQNHGRARAVTLSTVGPVGASDVTRSCAAAAE
jgi:hypothetical protein